MGKPHIRNRIRGLLPLLPKASPLRGLDLCRPGQPRHMHDPGKCPANQRRLDEHPQLRHRLTTDNERPARSTGPG